MTTPESLRARLLAHAELHESLQAGDPEQAQWAADLREAIAAIDALPSAPPYATPPAWARALPVPAGAVDAGGVVFPPPGGPATDYAEWMRDCRAVIKDPLTLEALRAECGRLASAGAPSPELLLMHAMLLLDQYSAPGGEPVTLADVLDALNLFNRPKPNEDDGPWEAGHYIRVDHLPAFINVIAAAWFAPQAAHTEAPQAHPLAPWKVDMAQRAAPQAQAVRAQWADAYRAFLGAFDTPLARRKDNSEYAEDARKRLRDFNDAMGAQQGDQP